MRDPASSLRYDGHMSTIPLYQVDAFADRPFSGNPAAVCPLETWLPEDVMRKIAAENNLSETAFFVRRPDGDFDLRWFTPEVEIDLCGHATLASAFVVTERLEPARQRVRFWTKSGALDVTRDGKQLALDLPSRPPRACDAPAGLGDALGGAPLEVVRARDLVCVYECAEDVRMLAPDMLKVATLKDEFGVIVTARGTGKDADVDFVSRFFAPAKGVPEDPVTGSAHCTLVPFWSARLGKTRLSARQVSRRSGELQCELIGERVRLAGSAVMVIEGKLTF
jgi:PhzF family phenazine biosynthesis protein